MLVTNFATNLKRLRIQAGFKQVDLAKKMGLPRQAIWARENGLVGAKPDDLPKFADALGCTVDDLVRPVPAEAEAS